MFFGLSWWVWGAVCLAAAATWAVVWPADRGRAVSGRAYVIIRWFHALTWLFLALNFFVRDEQLSGLPALGNALALLGLLSYIVFIVTLVRSLSAAR